MVTYVAGSKRPVGLRSRVAGAFLIRQELPRYICDNSQTLNSIQLVLHFKVSRVFFLVGGRVRADSVSEK